MNKSIPKPNEITKANINWPELPKPTGNAELDKKNMNAYRKAVKDAVKFYEEIGAVPPVREDRDENEVLVDSKFAETAFNMGNGTNLDNPRANAIGNRLMNKIEAHGKEVLAKVR